MSAAPWPPGLAARLEAMGRREALEAACWDAGRGAWRVGDKTVALHGEAALRQELLAELAAAGFRPEVVDEGLGGAVALARVDPEGRSVAALLGYRAGGLYPQERSSFAFTVRALAGVAAGARALDLCAAPGGKALLLARAGATLHANEPVAERRGALKGNLRRCGAGPETTVSGWRHDQLRGRLGAGAWEVVLVDAPCSGEGLLRRPEMHGLGFWSEARVAQCAARQAALLDAAAAAAAPGGRVIYATCTFAPEENELQVERLVAAGGVAVVDAPAVPRAEAGLAAWGGAALACAPRVRRFWPRADAPGEGLFGAVLRREEAAAAEGGAPAGLPRLWAEVPRAPSTPRDWPPLQTLHGATLAAQTDGVLAHVALEPTLAALRAFQADGAAHGKTGRARAVTWRHHALLVEAPLPRGRTFVRRGPLLEDR